MLANGQLLVCELWAQIHIELWAQKFAILGFPQTFTIMPGDIY